MLYSKIKYSDILSDEVKTLLKTWTNYDHRQETEYDFEIESNMMTYKLGKTDKEISCKLGKGLKKLYDNKVKYLKKEYPHKDIPELPEWMVSKWTEEAKNLGNKLSYKTVVGQDITDVYNNEYQDDDGNYTDEHKAWDNGSCMTNHEHDVTQIYRQNPKRIGLTLAFYEGKMIGRCLVWVGDDKKMYHDYMYAPDLIIHEFREYFASWGIERNFAYKDIPRPDVDVSNIDTECDSYPYIDNMTHIGFGVNKGRLSNHESLDDYCQAEYGATDGGRGEDGGVYSEYHNERIYRFVSVYSEYHNSWLYDHEVVYYEDDYYLENECTNVNGDYIPDTFEGEVFARCEHSNEYYTIDDMITCDHDGCIYHMDYVTHNEDLDMYIYQDNIDDAYDDNGWIKCNNSDEWVNDYFTCEHDNENYSNESLTKLFDTRNATFINLFDDNIDDYIESEGDIVIVGTDIIELTSEKENELVCD